jgi:hypothetical protein
MKYVLFEGGAGFGAVEWFGIRKWECGSRKYRAQDKKDRNIELAEYIDALIRDVQ